MFFIEKIISILKQQVVKDKVIITMEQVAIITKLVEEMIAMNCGERHMAHFILNLDCAVRTLTHIKEDTPRQMARDLRWEAGREEREAKEAEEKAEKRAKWEREEERKKEAQRQRRRELYQLKKAEKKARAEAILITPVELENELGEAYREGKKTGFEDGFAEGFAEAGKKASEIVANGFH